jgi:shikimate kinase
MRRILLTGMSGNGKSAIIEELTARGYRAVDIDQPGWSVHAEDGDWIWNEERVRELFDTDDSGLLFISGCAENQVKFYPQLDEIILLSAPSEVITERIRTRTNNHYGKDPSEMADVLYYLETVEPLLRRGATREIDTSVPLEEVVERVLEISGSSQLV